MDCAEDYLKYCLRYILKNNMDDLEFFQERVADRDQMGKPIPGVTPLIQRLTQVAETPFVRITYTEAVEILERDIKNKTVDFNKEAKKAGSLGKDEDKNKVYFGVDLASEHEKYLTDRVFKGPIIVYDYPKDIKAFYMKQNEDGKTVQAMDVLVPRIGELMGGSAREDQLDKLDQRINEMNLDIEAYWWYRDLRKYGSVPHAGFGLGFERLVMMSTGVENIRDVIPFPRAPGQAEF